MAMDVKRWLASDAGRKLNKARQVNSDLLAKPVTNWDAIRNAGRR